MLTTISSFICRTVRRFVPSYGLTQAPRSSLHLVAPAFVAGLSLITNASPLDSPFSVFEDNRTAILKSTRTVVVDPYVFVPISVPTSALTAALETEADERYRVSQSLVELLKQHAARMCRDNGGQLSSSLPINISGVPFQITYQKRSKDARVFVYGTERLSLERMLLRRCVFSGQ